MGTKLDALRSRADQLRARAGDEGNFNIRSILVLAGTVIGAVVAVKVLAALVPTWFGGIADLNGAFKDPNTTTNDTTADSLLGVFPILIGLAGVFAIVGAAILSLRLSR